MTKKKRTKKHAYWQQGEVGVAFAVIVAIAALTYPKIEAQATNESVLAYPEAVHFSECASLARRNCVVDGRTFWLADKRLRIADIEVPAIKDAQCSRERELGKAAAERLIAHLNHDTFALSAELRETNRVEPGYRLHTVSRNGESISAMLIAEGLAREWDGVTDNWCD